VEERDPFAVLVDDTDDVIVIGDDGDAVRIVGTRAQATDAPPGGGSRPRKKAAPRGSSPSARSGSGGGSGERQGSGGGRGGGGGGRGGGGGGGGAVPPKEPPPVDDAQATQRGILVIAATVIVGLIVFWFGIHRPAENQQTATIGGTTPNQTSRDDAPPVTQPLPATTAPAAPATSLAPSELKVLVANGVDPKQTIAGPIVTSLAAKGYTNAAAVDLTATVATSSVYYTEGLKNDAEAIAAAIGFPASSVAPMPSKPPTNLNGAKVLVVVGKDKA